jgi:bifunctional non-homologous end joining protein LigD
MERYPAGIGEKGFWQKDVSKGFPEWLQRVEVPKKKGVVHYPLISDLQSLLWVTNQNTVTQHVWTSRVPKLQYPDLCVFDLDPSRDDAQAVRRAALDLRDLLEEVGLPSWIKTSGSKGYHIVVPVAVNTPVGVVASFRQRGRCRARAPSERSAHAGVRQGEAAGRIYVDTGRNGYGATFAAAYAVRAKRGAPVSAPCSWEEVERGDVHPQTFTLRTMRDRVAQVGDLWADMRRGRSLATADGAGARADVEVTCVVR